MKELSAPTRSTSNFRLAPGTVPPKAIQKSTSQVAPTALLDLIKPLVGSFDLSKSESSRTLPAYPLVLKSSAIYYCSASEDDDSSSGSEKCDLNDDVSITTSIHSDRRQQLILSRTSKRGRSRSPPPIYSKLDDEALPPMRVSITTCGPPPPLTQLSSAASIEPPVAWQRPFCGPLPISSVILPPPVRVILSSEEDLVWAAYFRVLPQTTLITFDPTTGTYRIVPNMKGLLLVRQPPTRFYTPRFVGDVHPLPLKQTLIDARIGGYLSHLSKGFFCDSRMAQQTGSCLSSHINSVMNAYLGIVSVEGGHPVPDPSWTPATPHLRIIEPSANLSSRYSSYSRASRPIYAHPFNVPMEIFCAGYGPSYVMHQSTGLSHPTTHHGPQTFHASAADSSTSSQPQTGNSVLSSCSFSTGSSMPTYTSTVQHCHAIQLRNRNVSSVAQLPLGIRTAWDSWNRFVLANAEAQPMLNPLLINITDMQAMLYVSEFANCLVTTHNFALSYVSTVVDNLNHAFQFHGHFRKAIFQTSTNSVLKQTYAVAQLSEAPLQRGRVLSLLQEQTQPITLPLIHLMYDRYWAPGSWTRADDISNRGYFLIEALSMALGIRSSSLCIGDFVTRQGRRVKLNHYLRGSDVTYHFTSSSSSKPVVITGGNNHLRVALGLPDWPELDSIDPSTWQSICRAEVRCITSKPTNSVGKLLKKRLAMAHPILREKPLESQLLDCLIAFELSRNLSENQPFFARCHPTNGTIANLRTKESVEALRKCADELNLPRLSFSSKSGRITLSTVAEEAGLPQNIINDMGGWAPGSTISRSSYSRAQALPNAARLYDLATTQEHNSI